MIEALRMGLDVGSTTVKLVIMDDDGRIIYKNYRRHHTETRKHTTELLSNAFEQIGNPHEVLNETNIKSIYSINSKMLKYNLNDATIIRQIVPLSIVKDA